MSEVPAPSWYTDNQGAINQDALLAQLMYLPIEEFPPNSDVGYMINEMVTNPKRYSPEGGWTQSQLNQLNQLKNALDNGTLDGGLVMTDPSWETPGFPGVGAGGLKAATFVSGDTVVIAYRGTPPYDWIDNGKGLAGSQYVNADGLTRAEAEALRYAQTVAEKQGWHDGMNITATGHSKGAHLAQIVTCVLPAKLHCSREFSCAT